MLHGATGTNVDIFLRQVFPIMLNVIPNPAIAILVTVSNLIMEVTVKDYKANLAYGSGNKSGVACGSGPAFLVQHNNKEYVDNEWVTYTGANRWKPWGKTWIEPGRLFLTTDLEGAIQFLQHQMNGAGGGAGGAGAASTICAECGGNKKHKRVADGTWCSKSKRGRSAEKLKAEGDSAF